MWSPKYRRDSRSDGNTFCLGFIASDTNLVGIDHHNEITRVDVGRELSLVLATQTMCDFGGQTAEYGVGAIDDKPVVLHLM